MTESVPCYRAYRLGVGGGIADVDVIDVANDADALAVLLTMRNGHGIELWDRDRCVGTAAPCDMRRMADVGAVDPLS